MIARHRQSALAREPPQPPHRRRVPGHRRRSRARVRAQEHRGAGRDGAPSCARRHPTVIAVHGGDGTLHKTVTALGRAFGDDAAAADRDPVRRNDERRGDLAEHPRARRRSFLTAIVDAARAGRPLETIRRRCLRIGDELGFLFGSGLPANFLDRVLRARRATARRARPGCWCARSSRRSWRGPFIRKLFKRFEGSVRVDGALLEQHGVRRPDGAGPSARSGLGFKLVHRADDDPERFGVLAMHSAVAVAGPRPLGGAARARHRAAAGPSAPWPRRWTSNPKNGSMAYTIDGDLYRTQRAGRDLRSGRPSFPEAALCVDCAPARRYHGRPAMSSSFPLDGMRVRFAGDSNVGMKRAHNEDSFYLPESERLAIVADGMGGHASGEVASRMAVETIVGFFKATQDDQQLTWPFKMDHGHRYDVNRMVTAIKLANLKIHEQAQKDPRCHGMGTTVVSTLFLDRRADRRARRRQPPLPPPRRRHEAAHRGPLAAQRLHQDEEPLARRDRGVPAQERHRARARDEGHGAGRRARRQARARRPLPHLLRRPVRHGQGRGDRGDRRPATTTSTPCARS